MSKIWPSGEIKLYNIPQSDILNGKAVAFSSADEREQWFDAYRLATESPVTVVKKKKNPIRVGVNIATVAQANYMSFKNPDFDNKLYYCIIRDYDYVNNNVTEISYVIDWWYTDMFNITFEDCYMEREGLSVKEQYYLNDNPYNVDYCEKMRTDEPLVVTKELEQAVYELGRLGDNNTGNGWVRGVRTISNNVIGDGGEIVSEFEYQNYYGGGSAPGTNPYPRSLAQLYGFSVNANADTLPLIPCVMFTPVDFDYLDGDSIGETRVGKSSTGASTDWLRDPTVQDWETYNAGVGTMKPSARFKNLLNQIRQKSPYYLIEFPRDYAYTGANSPTGTSTTKIYYNFSGVNQAITGIYYEGQIDDAQARYTQNLYSRPYFLIAALPYSVDYKPINPVQEIIDLLTEWGMSSSILSVYILPPSILRLAVTNFEEARTFQGTGGTYASSGNVHRFKMATAKQRKKDGFYYGTSPKLLQAPYSYLSIEDGSGNNVVDYRYEDYASKNIISVTDPSYANRDYEFEMQILTDCNVSGIRMTVAPKFSKKHMEINPGGYTGTAIGHIRDCVDLAKAISVSDFPQAPYTTDAFMGFLAGVNQQIVANSNRNNLLDLQKGMVNTGGLAYAQMMSGHIEGAIKSGLGLASGAAGLGNTVDVTGMKVGDATKALNRSYSEQARGLGQVANSGGGLISNIIGTVKDSQIFGIEQAQAQNLVNMAADSTKGALMNLKGSVIADMYGGSSSAFAMRNYNAGTSGGIAATNQYSLGERLFFVHHRLRKEIIDVYDKFFKLNGYATGQFKKPAIATYLDSQYGYDDVSNYHDMDTPTSSAVWPKSAYGPQWEKYYNDPDHPSEYTEVFFTKMRKCYITGVNQDSRDFIEALFEGGCRFERCKMPSNS